MPPAFGHINSTFKFCHKLVSEGFRVIYLVPSRFQKIILQENFEVINCETILFNKQKSLQDSKFKIIYNNALEHINESRLDFTYAASKAMNNIIRKISPDLLLIDSFISYNYLLIHEPKPKTIFIQTMLSVNYRRGIPPLTSSLKCESKKSVFQSFLIYLSWQRYFLLRKWKLIKMLGNTRIGIVLRLLKKKKINTTLNYNRTFFPIPFRATELIMPPKSFDLNEISPNNQIYVGSSVNDKRIDTILLEEKDIEKGKQIYTGSSIKNIAYRKDFLLKTSEFPLLDKLKSTYNEKIWVYCSLGTVNQSVNKNSDKFFIKVIKAFEKQNNWEVIISTGETNPEKLKSDFQNIHVFKFVPQIEIIKYCKAVITHGGANTILECIHYLTPMLAYSPNNQWDYNGNISRLVYYGLGLSGNFNKFSVNSLLDKLKKVIDNPIYIDNLKSMRSRIEKEDGMDKAIQLIREYIGD